MANTNHAFNDNLLSNSKNLREYLNACATDSLNYTITLGTTGSTGEGGDPQIYNVGTVWTGTEYALNYTTTSNGTLYINRILTSADKLTITGTTPPTNA